MEQYLEATTVHGFSYLHRRNSAFDRILWIAIIVTGFSLASFIIHDSVVDWEENQTITTLESIARPIQEVQFPTVTVCPNEKSSPDNWAFLEKVLNGVAISKSNIDIWQDILQPITKQLFDQMEDKYGSNPTSPIWGSNQEGYEFMRRSVRASQLICKNKINVNDLRTMTADELQKLEQQHLGEEPFLFLDLFSTCDKCCENWRTKDFFKGIMNARFFIDSATPFGLGTFLSNFANLTHSTLTDYRIPYSIFDLDKEVSSFYGAQYGGNGYNEFCKKMSNMDKLLQIYFTDLGVALGFEKNHSLSLFDLPSLLTSQFNQTVFFDNKKLRNCTLFLYGLM